MSTTQVRITVTADQDTPKGDFTRVNEVYPAVLADDDIPRVVVDFGKVVVGYPHVSFSSASGNSPGVRLAFSETLEFLTDRSDFTRADQSGVASGGTDQFAVPAGGADWKDTKGYQSGGKVYADGLHGFRYLQISLDALPSDAPAAQPWGTVSIDAVWLEFTAYVGTPESYGGWFLSSDDDLNRYWYGAAYTNELVTDTFRSDDIDPRGADTPGPGRQARAARRRQARPRPLRRRPRRLRPHPLPHPRRRRGRRPRRARRPRRPPARRRLDPAGLHRRLHAPAVRLPAVVGDVQLGLRAAHRRQRLRDARTTRSSPSSSTAGTRR